MKVGRLTHPSNHPLLHPLALLNSPFNISFQLVDNPYSPPMQPYSPTFRAVEQVSEHLNTPCLCLEHPRPILTNLSPHPQPPPLGTGTASPFRLNTRTPFSGTGEGDSNLLI